MKYIAAIITWLAICVVGFLAWHFTFEQPGVLDNAIAGFLFGIPAYLLAVAVYDALD